MAKIGLSEGFTLIPKGTHVFKITSVTYKEDFGKLEVVMETAQGQKHTERFQLYNAKTGEAIDSALNAFSYLAKTALNDFSLTEIDHEDLVGCYIRCEVDHEEVESNRTPGKMVTFVRLGNKEPADGFDEEPAPAKAAAAAPATSAKKGGFDLNSILN